MPERKVSNVIAAPLQTLPGDLLMKRRALAQEKDRLQKERQEQKAAERNKAMWDIQQTMGKDDWGFFSDQIQPKSDKIFSEFSKKVYESGADPYQLATSPEFTSKFGAIKYLGHKSQAVDTVLKEHLTTVQQSSDMDQDYARNFINNFKDKDIEKMDMDEVTTAMENPRVWDATKATTNMVKDIKNQIAQEGSKGIFETGGKVLARIQGTTMRFATENGRIADALVDHVLSNEKVGERHRYDLAEQAFIRENGRNPSKYSLDDQQAVKRIYEQQYANDTSEQTVGYVRDQVRKDLEMLQQKATKNTLTSFGNAPESSSQAEKASDQLKEAEAAGKLNRFEKIYAPMVGYMDMKVNPAMIGSFMSKIDGVVDAQYVNDNKEINLKAREGASIIKDVLSLNGVQMGEPNDNGVLDMTIPITNDTQRLRAILTFNNHMEEPLDPGFLINQEEQFRKKNSFEAKASRTMPVFSKYFKPNAGAQNAFRQLEAMSDSELVTTIKQAVATGPVAEAIKANGEDPMDVFKRLYREIRNFE